MGLHVRGLVALFPLALCSPRSGQKTHVAGSGDLAYVVALVTAVTVPSPRASERSQPWDAQRVLEGRGRHRAAQRHVPPPTVVNKASAEPGRAHSCAASGVVSARRGPSG